MKRSTTMFLRAAVVLIGVAVIAFCVLTSPALMRGQLDEYAPVLVGIYLSAVPFFYALYQAFALLRLVDVNDAFSDASVNALKKVKYGALAIAGIYCAGLPYLFRVADQDDAPGVFAIGLVVVFATFVVATFAGLLQQLLRSAIDIKTENDLTV